MDIFFSHFPVFQDIVQLLGVTSLWMAVKVSTALNLIQNFWFRWKKQTKFKEDLELAWRWRNAHSLTNNNNQSSAKSSCYSKLSSALIYQLPTSSFKFSSTPVPFRAQKVILAPRLISRFKHVTWVISLFRLMLNRLQVFRAETFWYRNHKLNICVEVLIDPLRWVDCSRSTSSHEPRCWGTKHSGRNPTTVWRSLASWRRRTQTIRDFGFRSLQWFATRYVDRR